MVYSANTDHDYRFSNISSVKGWLELHEAEHAGYSDVQQQLAGILLAEEVERWLESPPRVAEESGLNLLTGGYLRSSQLIRGVSWFFCWLCC